MSCPATSGHCHPFPPHPLTSLLPSTPPQTSLIAADSHHVSQSVDTVNATDTYLHLPFVSCPDPRVSRPLLGRLVSDIYDGLFSMEEEAKEEKKVQEEKREKRR